MEETPENGKELSHSAHANGMNEWMNRNIVSVAERKCRMSELGLANH